jgi:hypothetical protein
MLPKLREAGWNVISSVYSAKCFGNWQVCLSRAEEALEFVRDRSQYSIDDKSGFAEMQAAGIAGVFNTFDEFASAVFRYAVLRKQRGATPTA